MPLPRALRIFGDPVFWAKMVQEFREGTALAISDRNGPLAIGATIYLVIPGIQGDLACDT